MRMKMIFGGRRAGAGSAAAARSEARVARSSRGSQRVRFMDRLSQKQLGRRLVISRAQPHEQTGGSYFCTRVEVDQEARRGSGSLGPAARDRGGYRLR